MSTVTIPAGVVPRAREGTYAALRDCAQGIDQAGHDPEDHERVRNRLQATWALLDAIGWSDEDALTGVAIDPREHGEALLGALQIMLPLLEGWLADAPDPAKQAEVDAIREFIAELGGQDA